MSSKNPVFYSDNTSVRMGKESAEYLQILFINNPDDIFPYEVAITRYCVPGRCDTYHFHPTRDRAGLTISCEGIVNISKITKLVQADLDKEQVVTLVEQACNKDRYYAKRLMYLLESIAPKSKSYRKAKAVVKKNTLLAEKAWELREKAKEKSCTQS